MHRRVSAAGPPVKPQGRECFAQWTALPGDGGDHWQWFHKYVVTRIALADQALGYTYPNSNPVSGMLIGSAALFDYEVPWRPRLAVLRSRERPGHPRRLDRLAPHLHHRHPHPQHRQRPRPAGR